MGGGVDVPGEHILCHILESKILQKRIEATLWLDQDFL